MHFYLHDARGQYSALSENRWESPLFVLNVCPPRTTFKQLYVRTRSTRQGLWKITSAVKERNSIST